MAIPVLTQLAEEVRRLAVAGSAVAPGDFRLQKLVPGLEQAGQKSPVLAKVAAAANELLTSDEKHAAGPLLDLATLVHAIQYTQGESGLDGELGPLLQSDLGLQEVDCALSDLLEVRAALHGERKDALDVIWSAIQSGLVYDARLAEDVLHGLYEERYGIGDFVAKWILPNYSLAVLPILRSRINLNGEEGDKRCFVHLCTYDPEGTQDLVVQALEDSYKWIKVRAIHFLADTEDHVDLLLKLLKSRSPDIRWATVDALARFSSPRAIEAVCQVIRKSFDTMMSLRAPEWTSPQIVDCLLEELQRQHQKVIEDQFEDQEAAHRALLKLSNFLDSIRHRKTEEIDAALIRMLDDVPRLREISRKRKYSQDLGNELIDVINSAGSAARKALANKQI